MARSIIQFAAATATMINIKSNLIETFVLVVV